MLSFLLGAGAMAVFAVLCPGPFAVVRGFVARVVARIHGLDE